VDLIVGNGDGLKAQYFNGTADFYGLQAQPLNGPSYGYGLQSLSNNTLALSRIDPTINFNWSKGAPDSKVNSDNFSAEWTGQILAPETGTYTFTTKSDDGIAVWVNGQRLINAWDNHSAKEDSGTIALQAGQKYDIKVDYFEHGGDAVAQLYWSSPSIAQQVIPQAYLYSSVATPPPAPVVAAGNGLTGKYYNSINLDPNTLALTRTDTSVNFVWNNDAPDAKVNADNYSAQWTGQILAPESGTYTFTTISDDGVRVWVNGQQLIDAWNDHAPQQDKGTITLQAGQKYDIKVEYYERAGGAVMQLYWTTPRIAQHVIPQAYLYSAVVTPAPVQAVTPVPVAPPTPVPVVAAGNGLAGKYYNSTNLDPSTLALTRTDTSVNFNWNNGAPDAKVNADNFSAQWTGQILAPVTGTYTIATTSDDGVRVWVNGQQLIDAWNDHGPQQDRGTITLQAGQKYDIKVEYYERAGGSVMQLYWSAPTIAQQVIPQAYLYSSVVAPAPDPVAPPAPAPIVSAPPTSPPSSTISPAFDDSTLPHDAPPSGVPSNWDWAQGPTGGYGNNIPAGWNAFTAWGQVYAAKGWNPPAGSNTRVQITNLDSWYLSKSTGKWVQIQHATTVEGAAFVEDFKNNGSKPADVKDESKNGGGTSVTAGYGYNYHFWTGRALLVNPSDIGGIYTRFQARLVLNDPNGVDDRASARYIANDGADYWRSMDAGWSADWSTNGGVGGGRFKFVKQDWQNFTMTTLPVDQLQKNPPPY
jgi:PA14 domain